MLKYPKMKHFKPNFMQIVCKYERVMPLILSQLLDNQRGAWGSRMPKGSKSLIQLPFEHPRSSLELRDPWPQKIKLTLKYLSIGTLDDVV